ncbi:7-carboxy-7-deazaguanine synthase QueE [Solemya velum gill symbiont]|uniref:7-carboxy-7-deazaguanine synthase n=1 Tax=Solemya velum gill symbiont TaxID=2340 RepID=A0A0B0H5L9_SOVGS|nr:7-carboxy-7-deazaguanine synthase QueE [Solemya velum gill symbiont]KHF24370.1 organic radical activating enzyme [Solemya velum gill symbiont]OOY35201.1 7-carboxy-7-deazaguanine synthase QueE [Solemya velum gill symbiont]OOY37902.1 7-carboxy-7-deazaguanine synthase QueE [Solemya velum gill symbiont]OOY39612.1 7-carboxy-7-deazaguanine synthase QueE [Solemya velum gill symbiont]OOY43041.1 7-carboxy-7-deazaguanine synthase QueE [Solemya velum gill symbiont]
MTQLRITEIFCSLQGESRSVGYATVFVRLTGCPLRCYYCDTKYAYSGGTLIDIDAIVEQVQGYAVPYVTVTGGEPLAQEGASELIDKLCDAGLKVSLETSGALDIGSVDTRVSRVLDIKTPGSGEASKNHWNNLSLLTSNDQVKFVICDRNDFDWSKRILEKYQLTDTCEVLFSPSVDEMDATQLADWIVEERLPVRFQLQLHKILWGDKPGV